MLCRVALGWPNMDFQTVEILQEGLKLLGVWADRRTGGSSEEGIVHSRVSELEKAVVELESFLEEGCNPGNWGKVGSVELEGDHE